MTKSNPFKITNISLRTLLENKVILFPFSIIAFIQLFIVEILYFMPRYPLNIVFRPIISTFFKETHMHYPLNLILLPKLFQVIQTPTFIFLLSFFIAVAISVIAKINNGQKVEISKIYKEVLPFYIHIVVATAVAALFLFVFSKVLNIVHARALFIRSQSGPFFMLKQAITLGMPYYNLLLTVLVTTFFAYIIPIIVIEKKKFFPALRLNFKALKGNFWNTFFIVFIPTLLYALLLLMRSALRGDQFLPEVNVIFIIFSIFVLLAIHAFVYTGLTINYLLTKESE